MASVKAFSLLELLVAMAVLVVLGLIVIGITDSTLQVTSLSHRRISADAGARQILDRIGSDFDLSLQRADLPDLIDKRAGNDAITFFAQTTGYDGDRGISEIGYAVTDDVLLRGVLGTSWTNNPTSDKLNFNTTTASVIPSENYEIVASDVFRFEVAFLMADGSLVPKVDQFVAGTNAAAKDTVRALVVGVVALDGQARKTLPGQDVSQLSALYPDAIAGQDLLERWGNIQLPDTLPAPVRTSTRVYQRYFFLRN